MAFDAFKVIEVQIPGVAGPSAIDQAQAGGFAGTQAELIAQWKTGNQVLHADAYRVVGEADDTYLFARLFAANLSTGRPIDLGTNRTYSISGEIILFLNGYQMFGQDVTIKQTTVQKGLFQVRGDYCTFVGIHLMADWERYDLDTVPTSDPLAGRYRGVAATHRVSGFWVEGANNTFIGITGSNLFDLFHLRGPVRGVDGYAYTGDETASNSAYSYDHIVPDNRLYDISADQCDFGVTGLQQDLLQVHGFQYRRGTALCGWRVPTHAFYYRNADGSGIQSTNFKLSNFSVDDAMDGVAIKLYQIDGLVLSDGLISRSAGAFTIVKCTRMAMSGVTATLLAGPACFFDRTSGLISGCYFQMRDYTGFVQVSNADYTPTVAGDGTIGRSLCTSLDSNGILKNQSTDATFIDMVSVTYRSSRLPLTKVTGEPGAGQYRARINPDIDPTTGLAVPVGAVRLDFNLADVGTEEAPTRLVLTYQLIAADDNGITMAGGCDIKCSNLIVETHHREGKGQAVFNVEGYLDNSVAYESFAEFDDCEHRAMNPTDNVTFVTHSNDSVGAHVKILNPRIRGKLTDSNAFANNVNCSMAVTFNANDIDLWNPDTGVVTRPDYEDLFVEPDGAPRIDRFETWRSDRGVQNGLKLTSNGTPNTGALTYSFSEAEMVRSGPIVFVAGRLTWSAIATALHATQPIELEGLKLPRKLLNLHDQNYYLNVERWSGITVPDGARLRLVFSTSDNDNPRLQYVIPNAPSGGNIDGVTYTAVTGPMIGAAGSLYFQGFYVTEFDSTVVLKG